MDIGKALTYFSEDERWVEKTAIGTGLLLVSTLLLPVAFIGLLGYFILFGYLVRLVRNVRGELFPVLPEWDQWGDDLLRGLRLACVYVVWALPLILVSVPLFIVGELLERSWPRGGDVPMVFLLCSACLTFLFGIAYAVFQPGFTIAFVRNGRISDGLQVSEIWEWTRRNIGNVVIVALLTMIASLIISAIGAIVGVILCGVGLLVTLPLSQVVIYYFQSHLYGQLARNAGSPEAGAMPPEPRWDEPPAKEPQAQAVAPPALFDTAPEPMDEPETPAEHDPAMVNDPTMVDAPTIEAEPVSASMGEPEAAAEHESAMVDAPTIEAEPVSASMDEHETPAESEAPSEDGPAGEEKPPEEKTSL